VTIFTDIYIGLSSTTVTYLASKTVEVGEKKHTSMAYYVIQGHSRS